MENRNTPQDPRPADASKKQTAAFTTEVKYILNSGSMVRIKIQTLIARMAGGDYTRKQELEQIAEELKANYASQDDAKFAEQRNNKPEVERFVREELKVSDPREQRIYINKINQSVWEGSHLDDAKKQAQQMRVAVVAEQERKANHRHQDFKAIPVVRGEGAGVFVLTYARHGKTYAFCQQTHKATGWTQMDWQAQTIHRVEDTTDETAKKIFQMAKRNDKNNPRHYQWEQVADLPKFERPEMPEAERVKQQAQRLARHKGIKI